MKKMRKIITGSDIGRVMFRVGDTLFGFDNHSGDGDNIIYIVTKDCVDAPRELLNDTYYHERYIKYDDIVTIRGDFVIEKYDCPSEPWNKREEFKIQQIKGTLYFLKSSGDCCPPVFYYVIEKEYENP